MTEQVVGRIGKNTLSYCADRAAEAIMEFKTPRAVCLDPDGLVTVEFPAGAIPDEMVGVYTQELGRFALWRQIEDDLRECVRLRRIEGGAYQRHRVAPGRKAA
ncbi:hypothetical protein [Luteibacter yeojuensis]|uniref:Uncharacterized protein n=1 Tax=Luteibacter yeojuensis TaxID=345309 RepID=A0A7X5TNU2_9GAMM|nr:hypothetical protein [Luteibacter yeojuensis]NID14330.1 hypothetical protein [Luteibacter yeojuensis]